MDTSPVSENIVSENIVSENIESYIREQREVADAQSELDAQSLNKFAALAELDTEVSSRHHALAAAKAALVPSSGDTEAAPSNKRPADPDSPGTATASKRVAS